MKENIYNMPEHTYSALRRYIDDGLEPGGFLTAFLENDLMRALGNADGQNIKAFKEIGMHLYNEEPCGCFGYKGVVEAWCTKIRKEKENEIR